MPEGKYQGRQRSRPSLDALVSPAYQGNPYQTEQANNEAEGLQASQIQILDGVFENPILIRILEKEPTNRMINFYSKSKLSACGVGRVCNVRHT